MNQEVTAIIDGEVRVLVFTEHEYKRVIHRSRDSARKKITSLHQFLIDITGMLKCPEPKEEKKSMESSEKQTESTK
jgi:hypothetical protein